MDLIAALLSCSMYFDDDLVRAIAESNSRANPYFVMDAGIEPTALDPPDPLTLADAMKRTGEIVGKGGRPVLGLMQLPPAWIAFFGRSNRDAFDPCTNIAMGTAMLSQFDYECGASSSSAKTPADRRRRPCVLEKYANAIGVPEFFAVTSLELRFQRPVVVADHLVGTPILFTAAAEPGAGGDRILVRLDPAAPGRPGSGPRPL